MNPETTLSRLHEAAELGGDLAREGFRGELTVESKSSPLDSVTEIDRAVQRRVGSFLADVNPDAVLVGEEDVGDGEVRKTVPDAGDAWVVDPIDGTNNFVAGNRNWGVAVAAVSDGETVAAVNHMPVLGDTYAAADGGVTRNGEPVDCSERSEPGSFTVNPVFGLSPADRRHLAAYVDTIASEFGDMRRYGCAQLALSAVASGELEAAVSAVALSPWDVVGGVHLIRRAGGTVTDVYGDRWEPGAEGLVASNGAAHHRLVEAFAPEN